MRVDGSEASGLAIVGTPRKRGAQRNDPLRYEPVVFKGVPYGHMDDVLRVVVSDKDKPEALAETLGNARVVVAIGGRALKLSSSIRGASHKLVGSCVREREGRRVVVPVETPATGGRKYRSFMWTTESAYFVCRALRLAQAPKPLFRFPSAVLGAEGATMTALLEALQRLGSAQLPVGVDVETVGDHPHARITAIGLADERGGVSVPWHGYTSSRHGDVPGLQDAGVRRLVLEILASGQTKLFHNGAFDLNVFRSNGVEVGGECHDTLLAHRVAFADLYHNLGFVAAHMLPIDPWKTRFEQTVKARKEYDKRDWSNIYQPLLLRYNFEDAAVLPHVWARLQRHVERAHNGWEHYEQLRRLAEWGADAAYHGMALVEDAVRSELRTADERIAALRAEWDADTGGLIPLRGEGSKGARRHYFFRSLKAPVLQRSEETGEPSLASHVLLDYDNMPDERLSRAAWTLFRYTKTSKSRDAFLVPWSRSGARAYARPNVAGTKGTRMSYSEPNLQQVSKDKELTRTRTGEKLVLAPNLRHCFAADPGCEVFEADYNALEVRLMAYAANIPEWLRWLADGVDMHVRHAELMFGRKVTKKDALRQVTKVLTFARFYNRKKSVGQVLRSLKSSMPTLTEDFLVDVFERFDRARPEVLAWQDEREAFVRANGYVEAELGGQRQPHDKRFPDVNQLLSFAIQSTGGNLINAALLRIRPRLDPERGERVLLQVHDALVGQAPTDRRRHAQEIVREEMERPVDVWGHVGVVFPVEVGWGPAWRDAKEKLV